MYVPFSDPRLLKQANNLRKQSYAYLQYKKFAIKADGHVKYMILRSSIYWNKHKNHYRPTAASQ